MRDTGLCVTVKPGGGAICGKKGDNRGNREARVTVDDVLRNLTYKNRHATMKPVTFICLLNYPT